MKPALRRALPFIRAAVAVGLLAWLFWRIPAHDVLETLARVSPAPLALAALCGIAAQVTASLRLRLVARHHGFDATVGEILRLNFAASFYALTVPAGSVAAGAVRVWKLGRSERPVSATGAVLADRLHAFFGTFLVGGACWLLDPGAEPQWIGIAIVGVAVAMPVGYLAYRAGLHPRLPGRWRAALGRESDLPVSAELGPVACSVLAQLFGLAGVVLIAAALGLHVPALRLGWVRAAVGVVVMVPVSVSGFGVREGALVALLGRYGVAAQDALAFSLMLYAVLTLVNGLVGGLVEAWGMARGKRETRS